MFRKIMLWLLVVVVISSAVFALGPREKADSTIRFNADILGTDIDGYLANAEQSAANLKSGAQKQMIWADPQTKAKTPYSVVYIHGYSATLHEIRPVPDNVAKAIGANLHFTRLKGHGRDGSAMAEPTANDWLNDVAEAIAIGRATGDKVILLSTSTGGTLVTWATEQPELMKDVVANVMVSPNFAVQAAGSAALTLPWARQILPKIFGQTRSWEPKNEQQRQWWSTSYPFVSLLPMQATVDRAGKVAYENIPLPTLFIFHPDDGVVKSDVTRQVAARWGKASGAKSEIHEVANSDDTSKHVIAGDILSPENTLPVTEKIIAWIKAL